MIQQPYGSSPKRLENSLHMNAISGFTYYCQNIDVNKTSLSQCKDKLWHI